MNDEKRTVENAPEIFRTRLEKLRRRGLLNNPEFYQAIKNAALKVAEEQCEKWADLKRQEGVQNPSPISAGETIEFSKKSATDL